MKTRPIRLISCLALAALVAGCAPGTPTPTSQPSPTEAPPTPKPSATPSSFSERVNQGVDGVMADFMQGQAMTGCSVVVVSPGEDGTLGRKVHSFGTLSADDKSPVDEHTEYEIGGLTKLFTALVLSVETFENRMSLSDDAQQYLPPDMIIPQLAPNYTTRLRDLALHTSGMPRHAQGIGGKRKVAGLFQQGYASDDEMVAFLTAFHPLRPPGMEWNYSNVGYGLLGLAESAVLADTYERVETAIISTPLGMYHTRVTLEPGDRAYAAQGYASLGHKSIPFTTQGDLLASSGLRSTPDDLGIFLQAFIAPDQSRYPQAIQLTRQALAPTVPAGDDPDISQGLGWLIYHPGKPDEVFYKAGLTDGFSAYIAYSAVRQAGYAVMCNAPGVARVVPQLNALLDAPGVPVDAEELAP